MSATETEFALANRWKNVGFSEIVKVRNKIMSLKEAGQQVFQFEGGEPFPSTPDIIKEACTKALLENKTRYAPSSGIPELLVAIKEKLQNKNRINAELSQLLVAAGGMQGLFAAFQAILNDGDEVILFSPYWTSTKDLISMTGGESIFVSTQKARTEGIEATLKSHITPRTRALYLCSPQNPNGMVFTRQEMTEIANFVKEHNLVVISDEAYEDLIYDIEHVSIASLPGMQNRTISVFTFSKSYSMTGWRLGYVVASEPFISSIKQAVLYSTNGVSTPTQWAGLAAMKHCDDFIKENLVLYRQRRDLLVNGLNELGLQCEMPKGAFYAFPNINKVTHLSSREFALLLLEQAKIATVPGAVFGSEGEGHLRFSYSVPLETIHNGLEAMKKFL